MGVSRNGQGGVNEGLKTRGEAGRPAARHPSDGSRGDQWNSPQPTGTRPVDELRDVDLHGWTPVRDRGMGCRQYTPSSNATTLESKKSVSRGEARRHEAASFCTRRPVAAEAALQETRLLEAAHDT